MIGILIIVWCLMGAYSNAIRGDANVVMLCCFIALVTALFKTLMWLHDDENMDGKDD